jgi:hypothetical protein
MTGVSAGRTAKKTDVAATKTFLSSGDDHWYESDTTPGLYYPSVTTILSCYPKGAGLNAWYASHDGYDAAREALDKAAERGTRVHDASEQLEFGKTLSIESYTDEQWRMIVGYTNWRADTLPDIKLVEKSYVSDTLRTGGTIDRVIRIGDTLMVVDLKTSKAIHDSYWIQVATYMLLFEEHNPGEMVNELGILRLSANTSLNKGKFYEFKTITRKKALEFFEDFKLVQQLWFSINGENKQPKMLELPTTLKL